MCMTTIFIYIFVNVLVLDSQFYFGKCDVRESTMTWTKRDEIMERITTAEAHSEMHIDERKLYDGIGEDLAIEFRSK